jgi:hypothetical protein
MLRWYIKIYLHQNSPLIRKDCFDYFDYFNVENKKHQHIYIFNWLWAAINNSLGNKESGVSEIEISLVEITPIITEDILMFGRNNVRTIRCHRFTDPDVAKEKIKLWMTFQ